MINKNIGNKIQEAQDKLKDLEKEVTLEILPGIIKTHENLIHEFRNFLTYMKNESAILCEDKKTIEKLRLKDMTAGSDYSEYIDHIDTIKHYLVDALEDLEKNHTYYINQLASE